jgi:hypothetical protein
MPGTKQEDRQMTKTLVIALVLVAFAPIAAHAADRDTVAEQVAEKCRKDYPGEYSVQLGCRMMNMEAFDKLEQEDKDRASRRETGEQKPGQR